MKPLYANQEAKRKEVLKTWYEGHTAKTAARLVGVSQTTAAKWIREERDKPFVQESKA